MALLCRFNAVRQVINGIHWLSTCSQSREINEKLYKDIEEARKDNMPVEMDNPYVEEKPQCVLCKYNIEPNYKNVRLLSQFVSKYTGKVYGRHITGLCEYQQKKVEGEIRKAQNAALMAVCFKDPKYFNDPDLYDETNPLRPHKYH